MELTIQTVQVFSILVALAAFAFAAWLFTWVKAQPSSNKRIAKIGGYIHEGAKTFLRREYRLLARFTVVVAIIIFVFLPHPVWDGNVADNIKMVISYIFGTFLSALAGQIGMNVATMANVKASEAAKKGLKPSFMTAFRGGAVMGMAVVGSSLLGVAVVLMIIGDPTYLLGFSFGASSLALFAKAGGGIFTKTADIAADLVGKVEMGIDEDDPRNPAVIADNVGDNVGDVAGMGADLFDSNVAAMSAALVMATALGKNNVVTVFVYAAIGLLASIIGVATARIGKKGDPTKALNSSTYVTTGVFAVLTALATALFNLEWAIWGASIIGLLVGTVIGLATDYYTNDDKAPVRAVAKASESGPAFTILSGFSYGLKSCLPALIGIALSALLSFVICDHFLGEGYGMFGISMSAIGMLSIVGMIVSNDAYGPIVDNARGLAEMGDLGDDVVAITDQLDSAGNTVKAVTKGFSISAAGLTVISLLGAFMSEVNTAAVGLNLVAAGENFINNFDIMDPTVFFGLIVGVAIPALFSAMLMLGVDRNAQKMVDEIHRQFDAIPGLKEGKEGVVPEYEKCIDIATDGALKELIPAGLMAIISTVIVGLIGGVKAIGGFLTGNIASGLLLALLMSNAGGTWDNAKKYVEAGNNGGKGSVAHKSAVVGDTVGDPFKDTAGPSINTQITVISLVASLLAVIFLKFSIF